MKRFALLTFLGLAAGLLLVACDRRPPEADPALIKLAVRSTVQAMPTATPRFVEVTRVIEVTRMIEVTRVVTVTQGPPATPEPQSAAPAAQAAAMAAPAPPAAGQAGAAEFVAQKDVQPAPAEAAPAQEVAAAAMAAPPVAGCPVESGRSYAPIPIVGAPANHPDAEHGDLNLALRGYEPVEAARALVEINGDADGDAPQLAGIFSRGAGFSSTYRVHDWDWGCGGRGCRSGLLDQVEVSLAGLAASPGEEVRGPTRGAQIYEGGFTALVLYADERRLTLGYTREDTVAHGYAVHLENFCVDPNLLALYRVVTSEGRARLPAVHNGDVVGTAAYGEVLVAVRDRGVFLDPRSRKDWWR